LDFHQTEHVYQKSSSELKKIKISKLRGLMMWSCFRAARLNERLGFEILHPMQYPRNCTRS